MRLGNILIILCFLLTTGLSLAQTKTASTGDWNVAGTWSPSGVPGDDDIILIPVGVTVTVRGTDHTLDNAVLVVRGTLSMESTCGICPDYASLTFTGSGSGVIIEDGGQINDDTLFGGDTHFISVDGTTFWSGDNCAANCGSTVGNFSSSGDTAWPSSMNNPLPVEFLFFTAKYENRSVQLAWATATEITNSHFEIERSIDAENFEKIGEVIGAGDSQERIDYQYIDYEAAVGAEIIYYRLRQVDYDGKFDYSNTVIARNSDYEPLELLVSPTLFQDRVTVTLNATEETDNINIEIYDMRGNKVYSRDEFLYTGINDFDLEDIYHLSEGAYLLSLTSNTFKLSQRIVKAN